MGRTLISNLLCFSMLAGAAIAAQAQELPAMITTLLEQLAEQGGDAEELVRYYEGLLERPLNLNAASRAQLEETGLLTLFQVESLVAWRERYGAIRSAAELGLVDGFRPEDAAVLRAFFTGPRCDADLHGKVPPEMAAERLFCDDQRPV